MRLQIDHKEATVHIESLGKMEPEIQDQLWKALQATSLDLMGTEGKEGIKTEMPVDTGRARASWGQWTPQDIVKPPRSAKTAPNPSDAIYRENKGKNKMEIIQGTNVPYVVYLNAGHSKQAPPGFIDVLVAKAEVELIRFAQAIGLKVRPKP